MGSDKISMFQGDDRTINISVSTSGTALDITGCTLWLTVKGDLTKEDTEAVMQVTGSIVDGTAGTGKFAIDPANSNKEHGDFYYDIQLKLTGGEIYTLIKDDFELKQDVTKVTS